MTTLGSGRLFPAPTPSRRGAIRKAAILIALIALLLTGFSPSEARPPMEIGGQIASVTSLPVGALRAAGMSWVKVQVFAPDGRALDFIALAHAEGFKVLLSVEGSRAKPMDALNREVYIHYVLALADAGVDALEIWNEANYQLEWAASARDYADLYRQVYRLLKAQYPHVMVMPAALMPTGVNNAQVTSEARWQAQLGGLPRDCTAAHYDDLPFTSFTQRMAQIHAIYGAGPLCFTELGILSPEGFAPLPDGFTWAAHTTVQQQGQELANIIGQLRGTARLVIVWNVNFTTYGADPQAAYSIVRPDGSCPACNRLRGLWTPQH